MAQGPRRRKLDFRDLDDVIRDVETLHAAGYDRAGNWDLAQTCAHLNDWMRYPLDGYPHSPLPIRLMLWALRHTVVKRSLRRTLARRSMPTGGPTFPETIHPPGEDEGTAVERLRATIRRFQAHDGPFQHSPLFGTLDRESATQLQLIHCAHHLSFLVPRGGD